MLHIFAVDIGAPDRINDTVRELVDEILLLVLDPGLELLLLASTLDEEHELLRAHLVCDNVMRGRLEREHVATFLIDINITEGHCLAYESNFELFYALLIEA